MGIGNGVGVREGLGMGRGDGGRRVWLRQGSCSVSWMVWDVVRLTPSTSTGIADTV